MYIADTSRPALRRRAPQRRALRQQEIPADITHRG